MNIMDYFRAKANSFRKTQDNENKRALFNKSKVLKKVALTLAVVSTMTVMTSCAKISEFNDKLREDWGWDQAQKAESNVINRDQFGNTIEQSPNDREEEIFSGEDALRSIENVIMAQTKSDFCQLNGIKTDTKNGEAVIYELQNYLGKNPHDAVAVTCNVSLSESNLNEISKYTLMVPTSVMEEAGLSNYLIDYTRGDIISISSAEAGKLVGMGNGVLDFYGQSIFNDNNVIGNPNVNPDTNRPSTDTPTTPPSQDTTPSEPTTPSTPDNSASAAVEQAIENAIASGNHFLGLGEFDLNSAKTTMNDTQAQVTVMQNYNGQADFECVFVECVVTENGERVVLHLPVPTEVLKNAGINDYIVNYTKGQSLDDTTAQTLIDAFNACGEFYEPENENEGM